MDEDQDMDDWGEDDDFSLTQADLKNIEILASQAYNEQKDESSLHPQTTRQTNIPGSSQYLGNKKKEIYSGKSTHGHGTLNHSISQGYHSMSGSLASSSSKTFSRGHPVQSNLTIPLDSTGVVELKTTDNFAVPRQNHAPLSHQVHNNNNKDLKSSLEQEKRRLKGEVERLQIELKKIKEQQYGKDGQIKMLRDQLSKRENELSKMRHERLQQIDEETKQQSEKEKTLEKEVEKLQSQLQFKEREILENQRHFKTLENKIKTTTSNSGSESPSATQTESPRPKKRPRKEKDSVNVSPTTSKSAFPTSDTFHSPISKLRQSSRTADDVQEERTALSSAKGPVGKQKSRMALGLGSHTRGVVYGPSLISKMISGDSNEQQVVQGLVSLLSTPPLQYDTSSGEEVCGVLASPGRNRRTPNRRLTTTKSNQANPKPIVSPEHYVLAKQALVKLLHISTTNLEEILTKEDLTNCIKYHQCTKPATTEGAILFLPIIEDFAEGYLDMAQFAAEKNSGTASNGSLESSLDSLSNSMKGMLSSEVPSSLQIVESCTINALQILQRLVNYSQEVRHILLRRRLRSEDTTEAGPSTSAETVSHSAPDIGLLRKVMRLANPYLMNGVKSNKIVVESSLDVLIALSSQSTGNVADLESLSPCLHMGILTNCLGVDASLQVKLKCLELMRNLVLSKSIVSRFCGFTDGCILSSVYTLCNQESRTTELALSIIGLLSTIISSHPMGPALLIETDCKCSLEAVKAVVFLMYEALKCYKESQRPESLQILLRGLHLLHPIAQVDRMFVDHYRDVEHQYVNLVCSMSKIFQDNPLLVNEADVSALNYLEMDYEPDEGEDDDDVAMETN